MTQEEEAKAAVDAGVKWLESVYGEPWTVLRQRITRPVRIKSNLDCPLAQLHGTEFPRAARELGISTNQKASSLGFTVTWLPYTPGRSAYIAVMWTVLQQEWERRTAPE